MEYPFDALHAGIESQILNLPVGIPDSQAIRQAKSLPDSVEKFRALGKALSRQLRYREAVAAYTEGLNLEPEDPSLLRLGVSAGRMDGRKCVGGRRTQGSGRARRPPRTSS